MAPTSTTTLLEERLRVLVREHVQPISAARAPPPSCVCLAAQGKRTADREPCQPVGNYTKETNHDCPHDRDS